MCAAFRSVERQRRKSGQPVLEDTPCCHYVNLTSFESSLFSWIAKKTSLERFDHKSLLVLLNWALEIPTALGEPNLRLGSRDNNSEHSIPQYTLTLR
jgi:hypothetical protein